MKRVIINEKQANSVFNLKESAGANDTMLIVADNIARQIAFNDIWEILSDTSLIESWYEEYDNVYRNSVEYDGTEYNYEIFYEPSSENGTFDGRADNDVISINYYNLETHFLEDEKRIRDYKKSWDNEDDEDTEEFDVYEYCKNAKAWFDYYEAYRVAYPIILHELTHTLDKKSDPMDRIWIKNVNRFNEDDVRNIIYLFSTSEMNARVASSASLFLYYYRMETSGRDLKTYVNENKLNELFYKVLMPKVLSNNELRMREMELYVGIISQEWSTCSKEYLQSCMLKPTSSVNSLAFHLALNEDKLYKRSNPRQVLKIYASNPQGFEEKVKSFYENLLNKYKSRIYKTCWNVFTKHSWEHPYIEDDADSFRDKRFKWMDENY